MTNKEFGLIKDNMFVDFHEELEDLVIESCEKQVEKKPYKQGYEYEGKMIYPAGINGVPYNLCPNCHTVIYGNKLDNYCCRCGQKLDWSNENG